MFDVNKRDHSMPKPPRQCIVIISIQSIFAPQEEVKQSVSTQCVRLHDKFRFWAENSAQRPPDFARGLTHLIFNRGGDPKCICALMKIWKGSEQVIRRLLPLRTICKKMHVFVSFRAEILLSGRSPMRSVVCKAVLRRIDLKNSRDRPKRNRKTSTRAPWFLAKLA